MEHSYDLPGIVKYALRREVMAWRTYDRLAQMAKEGDTTNMLLQLVGFEVDHVRQFTEILRGEIEATGTQVDAIVAQAEKDPLDLAGFIDEKKLASSSLADLLRFAGKFEQAMAAFYSEAARQTTLPKVKAVMERLAGEERSHERFVGDLLSSLSITPDKDPQEFPSL